MSAPQGPVVEDQVERTLLAWRRTAGSLAAAGLLAAHFATEQVGRVPVAVALVALALLVAYCWLFPRIRTAEAGLALVLGVLVLGALALVAAFG